MSCLPELEAN